MRHTDVTLLIKNISRCLKLHKFPRSESIYIRLDIECGRHLSRRFTAEVLVDMQGVPAMNLFILVLLVSFLSLVGCGGGGGDKTEETKVQEPLAKPLHVSEVSFSNYWDTIEKISLPVPDHWLKNRGTTSSPVLHVFAEQPSYSGDNYFEQVLLIKSNSLTDFESDIRNINVVESSVVTIADFDGDERVLTGNVGGVSLKILQVSVEIDGTFYGLQYRATPAAFGRNTELVRYMASRMEIGEKVSENYSLYSDLEYPGKNAMASDGESFLIVTCSESLSNENQNDLVGHIVRRDHSMGDPFVVHENVGQCERAKPKLVHDGENYALVYVGRDVDSQHVYMRRISNEGLVLDGNPINISRNADSNVFAPDLVADGDRLVFVWNDITYSESWDLPNKTDVNASVFQDESLGDVLSVATDIQNSYPNSGVNWITPKIARAEDQFLVVWSPYYFQDTRRSYPLTIYGQMLGSNLEALNGPIQIREDAGVNPRYVNVSSDGNAFVVSWIEGLLDTNVRESGQFRILAKPISLAGDVGAGGAGSPGIEIAGPRLSQRGIYEVPKSFLDVVFFNGKYQFVWSEPSYDGGGVFWAAATPDLSTVSEPLVIGGFNQDSTVFGYRAREPSIAQAGGSVLIGWVARDLEVWFKNLDDESDSDDVPTYVEPDRTQSTVTVTRANTPDIFASLNELVSFVSELAEPMDMTGVPYFSNEFNEDSTYDCEAGTVRVKVTGGGRDYSSQYSNCLLEGTLINGAIRQVVSDTDGLSNYNIKVTVTDFSISEGDESVTVSGDVLLENSGLGIFDPRVQMSLRIDNSNGEFVEAQNLGFQIKLNLGDNDERFHGFTGRVNYSELGWFNVSSDMEKTFLSGATNSRIETVFKRDYTQLRFQDESRITQAELRLIPEKFLGAHFNDQSNVSPEPSDYEDRVLMQTNRRVSPFYSSDNFGREGTPYHFNVLGAVTDVNGDPLTYQVSVARVEEVQNEVLTGRTISEPEYVITQDGISSFTLVAEVPGQYHLEIVGTDTSGLQSVPFEMMVGISADTDRDGFIDRYDFDDDNDGVSDYYDALPLDPTETQDNDGDNIGDNADPDDDNDGTPDLDDSYPFNNACALPHEGDGTNCYLELVTDWQFLFDGQGNLYFYTLGRRDIAVWNVDEAKFTRRFEVGQVLDASDDLTSAMIVENHHRLYFGFSSGAITYFDLSSPDEEAHFATMGHSVDALLKAPNHLLVFQVNITGAADISAFDIHGISTAEFTGDRVLFYLYGGDYRNAPSHLNRSYAFDEKQDVFYDLFDEDDLDQDSGLRIEERDKLAAFPIVASPDGNFSYRSDGKIYDMNTLEVINNFNSLTGLMDHEIHLRGRIAWTESGISYLKDNSYWRVDQEGDVLEKFQMLGGSLFEYGDQLFVVSQRFDYETLVYRLKVTLITPSDDTDLDGVSNLEDDFPNDPSASVDQDHDGHPDHWHEGYSEGDSTSGLTLDAYPSDVDCHEIDHGDGLNCDPASSFEHPNFDPEDIAISSTGIVYLWRDQMIHRYDLEAEEYIPSFFVGSADPYLDIQQKPEHFYYSENDHKIYFAYNSDRWSKITSVDLATGSEAEVAEIDEEIHSLVVTDELIALATESNGFPSVATRYLNKEGVPVAQSLGMSRSDTWNRMVWDPLTNRLFTNRWPRSLYVEYLDADEFTAEVTLLSDEYENGPLMELSKDGRWIVSGRTEIFDTTSGEISFNPNHFINDAEWMTNGNLATLYRAEDIVRVYESEGFSEIQTFDLSDISHPVAIKEYNGKLLLIDWSYQHARYGFTEFPIE